MVLINPDIIFSRWQRHIFACEGRSGSKGERNEGRITIEIKYIYLIKMSFIDDWLTSG
ncbi:hypothetical protein TUM20903_38600 [Citrobacter koseri]|nr:hypothetical protein TUM13189_38810 [Citrobacter koseri]BDG91122.1 hypothetical protein TUM20903_38600 [Citrobacter koseri]